MDGSRQSLCQYVNDYNSLNTYTFLLFKNQNPFSKFYSQHTIILLKNNLPSVETAGHRLLAYILFLYSFHLFLWLSVIITQNYAKCLNV